MESVVGVLEGSRNFLPFLLPLFFTISFVLIIITFVLSFDDIRKRFKVKRSTWIMLILIFLLGISLRIMIPVYFTSYMDEYAHINTGKNIATHGRAEIFYGYSDFERRDYGLFNEPAGFPYVVGLFFLFMGASEGSAYAVNIIMGSLLSVIIFFFCFLLFRNEKTGLYGAFLVSVSPLYILLCRNVEPDTVSAFFILLTFISFLLFFKIRNLKTGVLATSMLAFSMSIKQENIVLMPLVLLLAILFVDLKSIRHSIKNYKFWFLVAILIILVTPHIFHLSLELYPPLFYGKATATGVGGQLINIGNVGINAQVLNKAMQGSFYPLLVNLFLLIGVVYVFKKHRKAGVFLMIFFFSYMFVYLAYSAKIVEKYLITSFVPLICFAGIGIYAVEKFAVSRMQGIDREGVINFIIPLAMVVVLFLSSVPYFYEIREEAKPLSLGHGHPRNLIYYEESEAIGLIDKELGPCYLAVEEPIIFSATDLKVMRTRLVLSSPQIVKNIIDSGSCIFYFEDLYCTDFYSFGKRCGIENESFESCEELRQEVVSRCGEMHEKYELQPYLEYEFDNFTFTVYNISMSP